MPTTQKPPTSSRRSAAESDFAPLYALAGVTDFIAEKVTASVRHRIAESQQRANERIAALKEQPGALEEQAKHNADVVATFVRTLPEQVRELPTQARTGFAALQRQAETYRSTAETAYASFAGRGKVAVDEAISSARQAAGRAQAQGEDLAEDAAEAVDPLLEQAQETVTRVRKRATGRTATETVTPKSSVKTARTTAKKTPATKTAAKKAPAKKAPTAKKAPAKKTPAKKATKKV